MRRSWGLLYSLGIRCWICITRLRAEFTRISCILGKHGCQTWLFHFLRDVRKDENGANISKTPERGRLRCQYQFCHSLAVELQASCFNSPRASPLVGTKQMMGTTSQFFVIIMRAQVLNTMLGMQSALKDFFYYYLQPSSICLPSLNCKYYSFIVMDS